MSDLLARPLVPVANPDDAAATYEALRPYLADGQTPIVVHVVEKAGGAPDKAGVEQSREHAGKAFDAFRERAAEDDVPIETRVLYGTDVAETIFDAAVDADATAIAFVSRGGGPILDLLSGGVRTTLVTESPLPVVALPRTEAEPA